MGSATATLSNMIPKSILILFLVLTSNLNILSTSNIPNENVDKAAAFSSPVGVDQINLDLEDYKGGLITGATEDICNEEKVDETLLALIAGNENSKVSQNETFLESKSESVVEEKKESTEKVTNQIQPQSSGKPKITDEQRKEILSCMSEYDLLSLPLTDDDYLPAYVAARNADISTLKKIVGYRISLDTFDRITGETPLHGAVRTGEWKAIKFVLANTRNWNPRNRGGRTPFSVAVITGPVKVVRKLLRLNEYIDVFTRDNNGNSPIILAGLNYNLEVFELLRANGHDILDKNNSERSLLTLLRNDSPVHQLIMNILRAEAQTDKHSIIRKIAPELGLVYREDKYGGRNLVMSLLHELGISLFEMISAPQAQSTNLLMAILERKEYDLYKKLRGGFDINDSRNSEEFDQFSFFNNCLMYASREIIDYLMKNDTPVIDIHSFEAIFSEDRIGILEMIEAVRGFGLYVDGTNILVPAALAKANECLKHLGMKFYKVYAPNNLKSSEKGTNFFSEAALQITTQAEDAETVMNLFNTFPKAMRTCSASELLQMNRNINSINDDVSEVKERLRVFYYRKMNENK